MDKEGKRHGKGKMKDLITCFDSITKNYEGPEWKDSEYHGKGTYRKPDGY